MQVTFLPEEQKVADQVRDILLKLASSYDKSKMTREEAHLLRFDFESALVSQFGVSEDCLPKLKVDFVRKGFDIPTGQWIFFVKYLARKLGKQE